MKQKNKIYTLFARIALVSLASLLVVACTNSFSDTLDRLGIISTGIGSTRTLTIKISDFGNGSRTILPEAINAENISTYNVQIGGQTFESVSVSDISTVSVSIPDLAIGKYQLTVSGFDSDGTKITEGATTVTVNAGSCNASVVLKPIRTTDGAGKLVVNFNYTGAVGTAVGEITALNKSSVVLTKYPATAEIVDILAGVTIPSAGAININTSLPSGTYLLAINLTRTMKTGTETKTEQCPPITSIVQIYDNRISSATIEMTADDLTQPPKDPTGFRITGVVEDNMILEWNDDSNVAESYDLFSGSTLLVNLPAGTRSYSIKPNARDMNLEIIAKNRYGSSSSATLDYIEATKITLDRTSLVLGAGKTAQLKATVTPPNASLAPFIQWTSSTPTMATVSVDGLVTGLTPSIPGDVRITAELPTRSSVTADIYIDSSGFATGSGTKDSPYLVTNVHELDLIRYELSACYKQTENIALTDEWIPIGIQTTDNFKGTYNGNGRYITGLTVTDVTIGTLQIYESNYQPVGLFGATVGATLQNIGLVGVNIEAKTHSPLAMGALVGSAENTTISQCFSTDTVSSTTASNVGGLVGVLTGGSISQSWSSVTVSGDTNLGGLVGSSNGTEIINCYATGFVNGGGTSPATTSGLVGSATNGTITNCFAANGLEAATYGLVGSAGSVSITGSYWDITEAPNLIALSGVTGKTTAEMMTQATFVPDWDFETIWTINEDLSYPQLKQLFQTGLLYPSNGPQIPYTNGSTVKLCDGLDSVENNGEGSVVVSFTIYNNGSTLLTPTVTLTNADVDTWSIDPPYTPEPIPVGGGSVPFFVKVTWNDKSLSLREQTLTISYDDTNTPDFILLLTGNFSGQN